MLAPQTREQREQLLAALTRHRVEFVVVGSAAAILRDGPFRTGDTDIVIVVSDQTERALDAALAELDATPLAGTTTRHGVEIRSYDTPHRGLDVLTGIDHPQGPLGHAELSADADTITLDEGLEVRVAAIRHVLESKAYASRDKDLETLPRMHRWAIEQGHLRSTTGTVPAELAQRAYLTNQLGPYPSDRPRQERWLRHASHIDDHRARYGLSDPDDAFAGTPPDGQPAAAQLAKVSQALRRQFTVTTPGAPVDTIAPTRPTGPLPRREGRGPDRDR